MLNGYAVWMILLDNGDKNYYISHLDSTDTNKLTITSNSITANDAQSWFVLSLLVNSGTMSDKSLYINEKQKQNTAVMSMKNQKQDTLAVMMTLAV